MSDITMLVSKWTIVHHDDPYKDIQKQLNVIHIHVAYEDRVIDKDLGEGCCFMNWLCSYGGRFSNSRFKLMEDIHRHEWECPLFRTYLSLEIHQTMKDVQYPPHYTAPFSWSWWQTPNQLTNRHGKKHVTYAARISLASAERKTTWDSFFGIFTWLRTMTGL